MDIEPLWVSVGVTIILVIINIIYALEMRRMRIGSVKPFFTLRPGFPIGNEPMELYLMNNGGISKDVNIDVLLNDKIKHHYYVASIPNDGYVNLNIFLKDCNEKKDKIDVIVEYENSYGWFKKKEILNLDYKELTKDKREVKYYYTSVENKLLSIRNSLTELHNDAGAGKFQSDNITVYPTEKPTRGKRR